MRAHCFSETNFAALGTVVNRKEIGRLTFERVANAPEVPNGFEFVSASVSSGGDGLFLYVGRNYRNDVFETCSNNDAHFPKSKMTDDRPFKLAVVGEFTSYEIELPPLKLTFPHYDLFEDGRVLLASARAAWRGRDDYDRNGFVFNPADGTLRNFLLGDGIEALGVDTGNRIWVSYFDEGVFGNFGWNSPGPEGPGSGGLVCFDADGTDLWQFNRDDAADFMVDCYAMNITRSEIWAYYHSDFNLCRIDGRFLPRLFDPGNISGATAFAVSNDGLVFNRQYGEDPDCFHALRWNGDRIATPKALKATFSDGRSLDSSEVLGRGRFLHIIGPMGWFRADINKVFGAP